MHYLNEKYITGIKNKSDNIRDQWIKDITIETVQRKKDWTKKKKKKSFSYLWVSIKQCNIPVIWVPGEEGE